jgi:hypothetical protein
LPTWDFAMQLFFNPLSVYTDKRTI